MAKERKSERALRQMMLEAARKHEDCAELDDLFILVLHRAAMGGHPNPASLMLFRPVVLLMRNLQRIDLDVAHDRPIFLQPAFAELTDTPVANGSVHAGFFIGLVGGRLL